MANVWDGVAIVTKPKRATLCFWLLLFFNNIYCFSQSESNLYFLKVSWQIKMRKNKNYPHFHNLEITTIPIWLCVLPGIFPLQMFLYIICIILKTTQGSYYY